MRQDREALIGDPRNDENLLVAQLHLAFLHAHNALMSNETTSEEAETELRQRYQAAVLEDFLPTISIEVRPTSELPVEFLDHIYLVLAVIA